MVVVVGGGLWQRCDDDLLSTGDLPRFSAGNFSHPHTAGRFKLAREVKHVSIVTATWERLGPETLCVFWKLILCFFLFFFAPPCSVPSRCGAQQPELIQAGIWTRGSGRLRRFHTASSLTSAAFTKSGHLTGETFIQTEGAGSASLHPQSCLRNETAGRRFSGVAQAAEQEFNSVEFLNRSHRGRVFIWCCIGYCHTQQHHLSFGVEANLVKVKRGCSSVWTCRCGPGNFFWEGPGQATTVVQLFPGPDGGAALLAGVKKFLIIGIISS